MIEYLRNSANFRGAYDFAVDAAVPCQNENHIKSRLTMKACTCLENTPNRLLRFPYTKFFKLGRLFMKKIILSVAALALGCSMFAYDIASHSPVKGAVRTVTRTDFSVMSRFGEYFRTPGAKFVYKYDDSGRRTETLELSMRDEVVNRVVNTYDAAGHLSEQTGYDGTGALLWRSVVSFKNGIKFDVSELGSDNTLKGRTIYSYSGGRLSEETSYNADGAVIWKITYAYDGKGQVAEENEYSGDGALSERRVFTYTAAGSNDTISYYGENEMLKTKDVFRYGDNGILTEITTYGADGKAAVRTIVKFDNTGNIAKITAYNVAKKFGAAANEMTSMTEFIYSSVDSIK